MKTTNCNLNMIEHIVKLKISDHLKHVKKRNHWTYEQMAKVAHLPLSTIYSLTKGKSSPTLPILIYLHNHLDLSIIDLYLDI